MNIESQTRLIRDLVLSPPPETTRDFRSLAETEPTAGVIAGSQMLAFGESVTAEVRSAVTLSLLLAQEAAKADAEVTSPDQWVESHDNILSQLGWVSIGGSSQFNEYKKSGLTVHEAILPLLSAAFGPAATAGALILTGLTQLQKINEDKPWITLFERESRRFEHSEYRFATIEAEGAAILLRVVALRFVASAKRFQVLFFKTNDVDIEFTVSTRTLSSDVSFLNDLHAPIKNKLADRAHALIDNIDLPAFS